MRRDQPGSIWLASNLGPFGSSYVKPGEKEYLPPELGGEWYDFTPFGDRTWKAYYENGEMPTNPYGEWNLYEAVVFGADSLIIRINHVELNRLYTILLPDENNERGEPNVEGGVGLQSEGHEIFYEGWEVRSLIGCTDTAAGNYGDWYAKDSVPSACLYAGCKDSSYQEYNDTADIHDSTMCLTLSTEKGMKHILPQIFEFDAAKSELHVLAEGKHTLEILDISGNCMSVSSEVGNSVYNYSQIKQPGVYLFRLNLNGRTYTVKRIVNF
jgi:hypothetical protein